MEDIFYFSNERILLSEIKKIAESSGYHRITLASDEQALELGNRNGSYWQIYLLDTVKDIPEPEDKEFLKKLNMISGLCLCHHKNDINELLIFIAKIGEKYGGWIGNDEDGFEPRFPVNQLDNFRY